MSSDDPVAGPSRRRVPRELIEPVDDSDEETSEERRTSSNRKRTTVSEGSDVEEPEQGDPRAKKKRIHDEEFPNAHEYKDGAILKIKVSNFLTYNSAEWRPGPKMNMIIGPNGTGKSTLVCAVVIGLGGNPSILKDQNTLMNFVKHGREKAEVEITLRHSKGNIAIKREFSNAGSGSNWSLNGKKITFDAIKEKVRKLNIQVDNLCQVLPQDRVSHFAGMNSIQLLHETQRAALGEDMVKIQQELASFEKDHKNTEQRLASLRASLADLEAKNADLQAQVARLEERENIIAQIQYWATAVAYMEYKQDHADYKAGRVHFRNLEAEQARLKDEDRPLQQAIEALKSDAEEAHNSAKEARKEYNNIMRDIMTITEARGRLEELADNAKSELRAARRREEQRKKTVRDVEAEIETLRRRASEARAVCEEVGVPLDDNVQPSGKFAELITEVEKLRSAMTEAEFKVNDKESEGEELRRDLNGVRTESADVERRLQMMDDIRVQKYKRIEQWNPQAVRAVEWMKGHRETFSDILDPVGVEISVKDGSDWVLRTVETAIGGNIMAIVLANEEDYHRASRELLDRQNLRITLTAPESNEMSVEEYRRNVPIDRHELRRYGFDGYIIDVLQGPERILQFLCRQNFVHMIPFARPGADPNIDALERYSQIRRYFVGNTSFQINSRHGQSSILTTEMKEPTIFTAGAEDIDARRDLQEAAAHCQSRFAELEKKIAANSQEVRKHRGILEQLTTKRRAILEERAALVEKKNAYRSHVNALYMKESKLRSLEVDATELQQEIARQERKYRKACLDKLESFKNAHHAWQASREIFRKNLVASLRRDQLEEQLRVLKETQKERGDRLANMEALLLEAKEQVEVKKKATVAKNAILQHRQEELGDRWEELKAYLAQEDSKTLEECEVELGTEQGKLDAYQDADPDALNRFRRHEAQIKAKRNEVNQTQADVDTKAQKFDELKGKWYPNVKALCDTINTKFADHMGRIGCAGQVRLHEDQKNFETWGIEILVKFRDSESLQVLSPARQSGGERSVSTILYLMSMQELAIVPFRIVDEINQGMDTRNERLVHSQFVEVSCRDSSSQYFLVTPKLLQDLEYHENARICVVFNGDHLPSRKFTLQGFIERKRQLNASRAARV
ncbi:P-loop containing nucleoside triphosphate hydrolase protein [Gonapodya prolifera JEL478]|uniref:Structural maintenance of chromosomes protein 5 n=1 Tax=Gonapodya prolifera (strain JEL478) TaxID=1344416 RepID=A0A139AKQ3_GONPJ|nr:P-loop containing nucleoside triphosphate hydrolase protein [Gonapodya prolifera JEL478]|eukprot:KXS17350.1 P-loop containing nucleoside triphosphate hydrolase protein [Gonapodya prolifera JEL478]